MKEKGERLGAALNQLARRSPKIRDVRGRGLMWGIELVAPAAAVVTAARERGLLVATAGPDVVRLVPPLVIAESEIDRAVAILGEVLA